MAHARLPGQQEINIPDGLENSLVSLAFVGGPSRQQETNIPDGLENSLVSSVFVGGPSRTRQKGRSLEERGVLARRPPSGHLSDLTG